MNVPKPPGEGGHPPPLIHPTSYVDVERIVRTTVQETLVTLGMDARNPIGLQQDMAFLREMRLAHQRIRTKGVLILVGIVVSSLAAAAWLGIKHSINP